MRTNDGRRIRVIGVLGLSAAALAFAGGCAGGGSGTRTANSDPDEAVIGRGSPMPSGLQDVAFIDAMIIYSNLNTYFCEYESSNGTRADVQKLAEKIHRREAVNTEFLKSERARLGITQAMPNFLDDPYAADYKRRLDMMSGADVDAAFIEHMIRHRLEVGKLAERSASAVQSANLRYFCRSTADDAGKELRELRAVQMAKSDVPVNARAGKRGYSSSRSR